MLTQWLTVGLAALSTLSGCRPPQATGLHLLAGRSAAADAPTTPAAAVDEAQARRLAEQANALAKTGQNAAAERARDALIAQHPTTQAVFELLVARAQRATTAKKLTEAVGLYERLLSQRLFDARSQDAALAYAELLAQVHRPDDAIRALQALYAQNLPAALKQRAGASLAQLLIDTGRYKQAVELWVELSTSDQIAANLQQSYIDRAASCVDRLGLIDAESLHKAHSNQPSWAGLQPLLAFKLARIYLHTRDDSRCELMLQQLISRHAQSPYASQAQDLLLLLHNRAVVDAQAVGVLLPLSGKFKQYGERSLQAIQLAFASQSHIKLVVRDTQGEASLAALQAESLVLENHVIAIVGPLFSTEAWAAALKAEELGVPLLALSFREGLPQIGPYVFRNALTVAAQAKALAKQAFDELGMTRFALLYPRSRYGLDFTAAFWDEVVARHGEIRGAESYEPDQTTFREPVRKLVGRWFLNARPEYKEALDGLRKQNLSPMRMRYEIDRLDKSMGPIVDFDAIVLPDSGRQIGLLAPALAFEDIVLTHDTKRLEKIRRASGLASLKPVTLLGASTWNTAQTIDSCDQYCEDAVFVDAFFAASPSTHLRDFVAAYHAALGADPYLSEAQAYDAAGLLLRTLGNKDLRTRAALRDALLAMPNYSGVTGDLHFDADGEAQRNLFVLTIKDHTIVLLRPNAQRLRG